MPDVDRATLQLRQRRMAALRPLFDTVDQWGPHRAELARRLGMPRMRLWRYEHGWDRLPSDFISRACHELRMPQSSIRFDGPDSLFIQQPRNAATVAKGHGDDSQRTADQQRTRRTQPTSATPSEPRHTARHGAPARHRSSSDAARSPSGQANGQASGRSTAPDAASRAGRRVATPRHRTSVANGLAVTGDL